MFDAKLNKMKKDVALFAALIEKMIVSSVIGLSENDKDLFQKVIQEYEPRANEMELRIERKCTALIAQFEPKAKNLRTVLMILKMTNDFERMGDLAVNICESGLFLIEKNKVIPSDTKLKKLENKTTAMFIKSIKAFTDEDTDLAIEVCDSDNYVDNLNKEIIADTIADMKLNPESIDVDIHQIRISRNLERIADLSTNIAEDVMYMVKGKVIKHGGAQ